MNLSEIVADVKQHFDEFSVLDDAANKAVAARDNAKIATAKVLDDAITGLQTLRASLNVPKVEPTPPAEPAKTP